MGMKCDKCDKRAWYIGKHIQVCRDHHSAHLLEMKDSHIADLTEQNKVLMEKLERVTERLDVEKTRFNRLKGRE